MQKSNKETYTLDNLSDFFAHSNAIEQVFTSEEVTQSLKAWAYLEEKDSISLVDVLACHYIILQNLEADIAGKIRDYDVCVGGRKGYPPSTLEEELGKWIAFVNIPSRAEEIKQHHILFEFIHPFGDGNGRTGRLIWLWERFKNNIPFELIDAERVGLYYWWFRDPVAVAKYQYRGDTYE